MHTIRKIAKLLALACGLAVLPAGAADQAPDCSGDACAGALVYFGSRSDAPGQSIQAARFDSRSGDLRPLGQMAEIPPPLGRGTLLRAHPVLPVLYSVSDAGNEASVYSLAVDRATGQLRVLNKAGSGGVGATHLHVDTRSETLFVANYVSGSVSALPIQKDGSLGAVTSVQSRTGSGPSPRQQSAHAHSVELDPAGRFLVSADLGADRVFVYRFDPTARGLTPADPPAVSVAPGSGPRHTAFHPNGQLMVLITELTAELHTYRLDGRSGRLDLLHKTAISSVDFKGTRSGAEVLISSDGRFVYASDRGEDTVVVYSLDATSGELALVQRIPAQGHLPWAMRFDPSERWLLVANMGSNAVNVFKVDLPTGMLTAAQATVSIPSPSSIEFARR